MTLRLKLFVLIAGVIIFAMSGVTAVALWREVVRGQELLLREGVALASTAATGVARWVRADGVEPGGDQALPVILERLVSAAPLDRAWVVDRAGKVLACTSRTAEPCPEGAPPSEFQSADWPLQAIGRLIHPEGIVASAPVLRGGDVVGAVRVDFAHEEVVGNARNLAWGASLVAAFWILLGHGLAVIFIRQVTEPLVSLAGRPSRWPRSAASGWRSRRTASWPSWSAPSTTCRPGSTTGAPRTSGSSPSWRSAWPRRRARCSAPTGSPPWAGSRPASPTRSGTRST